MVLDTGTSLVTGPTDDMGALLRKVCDWRCEFVLCVNVLDIVCVAHVMTAFHWTRLWQYSIFTNFNFHLEGQ